MLRTTGLVFGMASKVPHGHMDKLRSVCKSCVGRPELDMNVIGLRVFPLSLTGDAAVFFFEISQVDSHIWPITQGVCENVFFVVQEAKLEGQIEQLCSTTRRVNEKFMV